MMIAMESDLGVVVEYGGVKIAGITDISDIPDISDYIPPYGFDLQDWLILTKGPWKWGVTLWNTTA